jgi:CubicO group peptidase (beta-lactamase class C family)
VHQCFVEPRTVGPGNNNDFVAANQNKFFYNGGHFQWLADGDLSLGATNNASLAAAVAAQVGNEWVFAYDSPQLAAGVKTTAADYGFFLRKILSNQLRMHDALGTNAVCTNPLTCSAAVSTPIPTNESWHYSIGHWVEDDPAVGDGAFSSPGAFGFYPWIDASKTYYGILAREVIPASTNDSIAVDSVSCGRAIRKAWLTASPQ